VTPNGSLKCINTVDLRAQRPCGHACCKKLGGTTFETGCCNFAGDGFLPEQLAVATLSDNVATLSPRSRAVKF
jgi:hypothetical protein